MCKGTWLAHRRGSDPETERTSQTRRTSVLVSSRSKRGRDQGGTSVVCHPTSFTSTLFVSVVTFLGVVTLKVVD